MSLLIPVKYHKRAYPSGVIPKIEEISCHFDVSSIKPNPNMAFSLHTEYSHSARNLNSPLIEEFDAIKEYNKRGIPQLWFNKEWAHHFGEYIIKIVGVLPHPKIIEIHPPFNDYCSSIENFLDSYSIFEYLISKKFKDTNIFLENRSGSYYSGGKFLISTVNDFQKLFTAIEDTSSKLKLVLDVQQLFTAYKLNFYKDLISPKKLTEILKPLKLIKKFIAGFHFWGKKPNSVGKITAHHGDLSNYFNNNNELKTTVLTELNRIFDDGTPRYFVPEVNTNDKDLESIIDDLINHGFKFV